VYFAKTYPASPKLSNAENENIFIYLGKDIILLYHDPVKGKIMLKIKKNEHRITVVLRDIYVFSFFGAVLKL
jgi:hypothetical protein